MIYFLLTIFKKKYLKATKFRSTPRYTKDLWSTNVTRCFLKHLEYEILDCHCYCAVEPRKYHHTQIEHRLSSRELFFSHIAVSTSIYFVRSPSDNIWATVYCRNSQVSLLAGSFLVSSVGCVLSNSSKQNSRRSRGRVKQ